MTLTRLIVVALAVACFSVSAAAQNTSQFSNDTGLALEVSFLKSKPPAYQPVGRLRSKKSGSWYGLFGTVPGWKLPQGALPISAVRLVPYLRDEVVNIRISVLRGQFLDVEDSVAAYKARENESITVTELEAFGVEPFFIKVVRPMVFSDLPTTQNLTTSTVVVGLEPVVSTLPRYKLTLHNLAGRNISALFIRVLSEGRVRLETMPQGDYGEPVIKAGESTVLNSALGTKSDATVESVPLGHSVPMQAPQIVIASLVFDDGSYEGEAKPAARFLGFVVGRRVELRRLLPLLDNAARSGVDAAAAADMLRSDLGKLSFAADETEVSALVAAFPSLEKSELRNSVDVAIHGVRKDLLDQLARVEKAEANATAFSAWLARTQKLYSSWLSHLEAVKVQARLRF